MFNKRNVNSVDNGNRVDKWNCCRKWLMMWTIINSAAAGISVMFVFLNIVVIVYQVEEWSWLNPDEVDGTGSQSKVFHIVSSVFQRTWVPLHPSERGILAPGEYSGV